MVVGLVVPIGIVATSNEPDGSPGGMTAMSESRDRRPTSEDPEDALGLSRRGQDTDDAVADHAGDVRAPSSSSGASEVAATPDSGEAGALDPRGSTEAARRPAAEAPPTKDPAKSSAGAPDAAASRSFPGKETTGYRACKGSTDDLTPMSGPVELGPGEVLENFDLRGHITVTGKGAVIRCGRIRSGSLYAIVATRSGDESFTVEDVEMQGTASDHKMNSAALAPYGRWTARRIDVWRFKDGIKLGSNQTIEKSWIHDLWKVEGSHNDGMQSVGGRNVVIRGNNIEGPWRSSTSALILGAGSVGYLEDYMIEGNRLSGGGYSLYIGGNDGNPTPQDITVRDNLWVRGSATYGPLSVRLGWPARDGGAVWDDNVYDDGSTFAPS